MSILSALTVAPIVGVIAGLCYIILGLPASLVLEKSKRFQNWKNGYIKSIVQAELVIVAAIVILTILGFASNLIGLPESFVPPFLLIQSSLEVLVIFSTFPLIGCIVKEGLKKLAKHCCRN